MATWELQLVSRIVRAGDLNSVVQWGITEADFLTPEGKAYWRTLWGYYAAADTTGAILGAHAFQTKFPNFQLCDDPTMTTEALCAEVRRQRLSVDFRSVAQANLELVDHDPLQAISQMQACMTDLQNIGMSQVTDVHFYDGFARGVHRMELIEQGFDLSCGAWPWLALQEATLGLQEDDYVILYGRPKSMKTWVLAYLMAWFFECRKRILIYTKEMTPDNIFFRAGACLARVRYQALRSAQLDWEEKQAIYAVQRMLYLSRLSQSVVCLSGADATEGGDNVPWLRSKIEQYKPDIVFIDGLYLMSDTKGAREDHARVRNISRGVRQMNLDTRVPVIGTLQANRAAAKNQEANLDEIAFSDSIGMDATILARVINEKDKPTLALVMGGSREFKLHGFRIYGVPAVNFGYEGEISVGEILTAKEKDDAPEDTRHAKKAKKILAPQPDIAVSEVLKRFNQ
jgi:hypothetical protein